MKLSQDQIYTVEGHNNRTYAIESDNGKVLVPSVTTIINFVVNKPALPPWAYNVGLSAALVYIKTLPSSAIENLTAGELKLALQEAALTHKDEMNRGGERGIEVHKALEAIISGEEYDYSEKHKPYIETLLRFIEEYQPEWHNSEFKVASLNYKYAGQFDGICTIHAHPSRRRHESLVGKRVLLDIKTNATGAVYPETHLPQVEAYSHAFHEMGGNGIDANMVVGIGPDGKFSPCVSYARFETFKRILDLYYEMEWMKLQNPNKRK